MITHRFYDFSQDVIAQVLEDFPEEGTVYVFPTERSKKEAIRKFQTKWQFSENLFLTMEEFKESILVGRLPLLREEKRNIALYHALSQEQKRELKIDNFFQFISFAHDFFTFWEEFSEEEIDVNKCISILEEKGEEILDWQRKILNLLIEIRENYRKLLQNRNWTDRIFAYSPEGMNFYIYREKKRFIFINQHYYTKLENRLLKTLQDQNHDIAVCYQLPEIFIDKELNRILDKPHFPVFDPQDHRTEKIKVYIAQNDFSMYRKMLELIKENPVLTDLFDSRFYRSSYPRFLSPAKFSGIDFEPLINCRISLFLCSLTELISNIFYEEKKQQELIPLPILKKILAEESFFSYFESKLSRQEPILEILDGYLRDNINYIDLELRCFDEFEKGGSRVKDISRIESIELLKKLLKNIFTLINNLAGTSSIKKFIDLIDTEDGLQLRRLITPKEREFSNIPEAFYTALADFAALEDLGIIDDRQFWREGEILTRFTDCLGILKLLLLYLRPKRSSWYYESSGERYAISSLMDSRNLTFEEVAILNVTEGILPAGQSTPFLFTEAQRKNLGLKTYEDIRSWDKYYFFRLVLNSRHVYLLAQNNINRNIEISSFIEELKLLFRDCEVTVIIDNVSTCSEEYLPDLGYREYYRQITTPDESYQLDQSIIKTTEFYTIPFDSKKDLSEHKLPLSYSTYQILQDSPFSFFLNHICKIREEYQFTPLSPLLIGTIVHQIIDSLWKILQIPVEEDLNDFFEYLPVQVKGILKQNRENFLSSGYFYYRIPHTYNYRYFAEIFLPILEDGIAGFFEKLGQALQHKNSPMKVLHEIWEPDSKFPSLKGTDINLYFRGRADLIIEEQDKENNPNYLRIFDYKTGSINVKKKLVTQLVFYELLFHYLKKVEAGTADQLKELIPDPDLISSYIFSFSSNELVELTRIYPRKTRKELFDSFIDELTGLINTLQKTGYIGMTTRSSRVLFPDVVRTDLLRKHIAPESFRTKGEGV